MKLCERGRTRGWRKEWDSNPRGSVTPCRFSRPVPSTTRPSFQSSIHSLACRQDLRKRIGSRRAELNAIPGRSDQARTRARRHRRCGRGVPQSPGYGDRVKSGDELRWRGDKPLSPQVPKTKRKAPVPGEPKSEPEPRGIARGSCLVGDPRAYPTRRAGLKSGAG
jgi:hypothetical protein